MNKVSKKMIMSIIVGTLIIGNIYFYSKMEKLDYSILIGTPVSEERTNYNEPLNNKDEAHIIQFALMTASSIEKPMVSNNLPDATFMINDNKKGVCYLKVNAWIDGEDVVFEMGIDSEEGHTYKSTDIWGSDMKMLINKYSLRDDI